MPGGERGPAAERPPRPVADALGPLSFAPFQAPRGDVCLAFVHYPVADHLQACDPSLAHKTLEDLNAALRDTLCDFAGYEVECMPGFFYASFSSSEAALRWATSAQEVTMELDWPDELLEVSAVGARRTRRKGRAED